MRSVKASYTSGFELFSYFLQKVSDLKMLRAYCLAHAAFYAVARLSASLFDDEFISLPRIVFSEKDLAVIARKQ